MSQAVCDLCGTPNVGTDRCSRCGQRLSAVAAPPPPPPPPSTTGTRTTALPIAAPPPQAPRLGPVRGSSAPATTSIGGRRAWGGLVWVAAAVLLASAGIGGGWLAAKAGDDEHKVRQTAADPSPSASAETEANPAETTETTTESVEPAPTQEAPPQATCWDGTVVAYTVDSCPAPTGEAAMFSALGVAPSQCRKDAGSTHNLASYACVIAGAPVHVAMYVSEAARQQRLSSYGACVSHGGGRVLCGPAVAKRWVRTFEGRVLFYASVPNGSRRALMTLDQLTLDELQWGRPI